MVERFMESLSQQINDSGNLDGSLEVKHIQSPLSPGQKPRIRHRCVTELDRENIMNFVRDFEARNSSKLNSNGESSSVKVTPKGSPFLCRKAKAIYQNAFVGIRSSSPKLLPTNSEADMGYVGSEQQDSDERELSTSPELMPAPEAPTGNNFQRAQPERSSLRSAAKMLQFFSAKKKNKRTINNNSNFDLPSTTPSSCSNSATGSPVLLRAQFSRQKSDCEDDEHDDGISSAGSNFTRSTCSPNGSPDSSFEMHAPLLPTFKITPPQVSKSSRNPAYEFARFLRGSFHAKRATITNLRRSISDPDSFQHIDFTQPPKTKAPSIESKKISKMAPSVMSILNDTTNLKRNAETMRNRALPANSSPFRRAWGQSSFRTTRTENQQFQQHHTQSPTVRRAASMTASDNDVYLKSMDTSRYIEELKQTQKFTRAANGSTEGVASSGAPYATPLKSLNSNIISKVKINVPHVKIDKLPASNATESTNESAAGVTGWATSFERLIEDPAGLHTFAEFLKKEFSAENIYFWTACERYKQLENTADRVTQAMAIFSKHLGNGALEPVNVDSQARNLTEEKLQSAERDIFAPAQKQIFNLMKFDSYQRFIRSDLYKSCLEAEEKQQPLPFGGDDLDELLKINFHQNATSKLKKSASNAEDRRRKSLLPWHRKTRSKSRDRIDADVNGEAKKSSTKLNQLSGSSLKIPSSSSAQNSVHSSRSSLSSFDALPGAISTLTANGQYVDGSNTCSLCRVILSDGATTIVQTRSGETVGQLVERLLEKRGLSYHFYDVVVNGSTKSIDLQNPAKVLAGKEVLIEQRVAFKLDLPDPKVISVKSKPKKQLHEVIRPILQKYNYAMESVQVLIRDTQTQLDLQQPVTVVDGQRLQIVQVTKPSSSTQLNADYQNGYSSSAKYVKSVTFPNNLKLNGTAAGTRNGNDVMPSPAPSQSTLDEITNKVFNELMQGKVEAHATDRQFGKSTDLCSLKSDDCGSDTSSIFDRIRRRDSSIPGFKLKTKKKSTSSSQQSTEDNQQSNGVILGTLTPSMGVNNGIASVQCSDIKKPLIAKMKAGVKLQTTERVAENQDELLEGLKRAQLARLEDQRGTEINFELPEFLKNKENLNTAASKLRKLRANLSPINKGLMTTLEEPVTPTSPTNGERPQPAPRLSITNKNRALNGVASPRKVDEETIPTTPSANEPSNSSSSSLETDATSGSRGPPPLPPKPKVLPIKPSNWGVTSTTPCPTGPCSPTRNSKSPTAAPYNTNLLTNLSPHSHSKIPIDLNRKDPTTRCAYLEEPSSSFV